MPTLTRVALPSPAELITDVLGLLLNYFFLLTLKFTTREGNPFKQRQKKQNSLKYRCADNKAVGELAGAGNLPENTYHFQADS